MGLPIFLSLIPLFLIVFIMYKQAGRTSYGGVPEKTSLLYLTMGILWIILSDKVLNFIVTDKNRLTYIQTFKGWFYVVITTAILYLILSKYMEQLHKSHRELSITYSELKKYGIILQEQIEEKELSKRALDASERRYKSLYEAISGGVIVQDSTGKIIDVNNIAAEILGLSMEDMKGTTILDTEGSLIYPDGKILTKENHPAMLVMKTCKPIRNATIGIIHPTTKQYRWLLVNAQPILDKSNTPKEVVTTFIDITDLKSAEETIRYQSYHDPLTGLPNRTHFLDKLTQGIAHFYRKKKSFALLFIDLDRFKHINDSLGHNVGDDLLIKVAAKFKELLTPDDLVARLGGDEFVILLQNVTQSETPDLVAKEILNHFNKPLNLGTQEIHITPSIGIAIYPRDGGSPVDLLKNSELAMYKAKDSGKNKYNFYSEDLQKMVYQRHILENSMRKSLEREDFEVYYQPQVDITCNQIVGVEALIRWKHPELGMISPSHFIPIAEETGLIIPMEEWVLHTACNQVKEWQQKYNKSLRLAVNISPHHFQHENLLKTIIKTINNTNFCGNSLELEITETAAMQNVVFTIKVIENLRKMGIEICIDDFGTGYSSLGYLKKFTIHKIKIDRSFICNLTNNTNDAAITDAVIALSHSLNLMVVAEGVETEEQLELLRGKGCNYIQGYYFKPPIPAMEMEELLKEQNTNLQEALAD
ncbi:sensor domain-containing protein [Alkaliphilus serpentinus]|nr:EAL domain-containing protein [Alkaliphilus serpentinus]